MIRNWVCAGAGCNICSNAIRVGKSLLGDDLYRCSVYKRKHKKISASNCNAFRCNESKVWNYCRHCSKGK